MAKVQAYRGPLHGWHCQILTTLFMVINRGISPWMKTPHALRRPLPEIEPARNSVEFRVVSTFLPVRPERRSSRGYLHSFWFVAQILLSVTMQRCMSESSEQRLNLLLPVATQMAGALHRVQPQGSYGALKTMNRI